MVLLIVILPVWHLVCRRRWSATAFCVANDVSYVLLNMITSCCKSVINAKILDTNSIAHLYLLG